jgi:cytochrome c peroxidase
MTSMMAMLLGLGVTAAAAQQNVATPETTQPAGQVVRSGNWSLTLPLGLQAESAYVPESNPMNDDKIALGKLLYFDQRLSKDRTLSCASCHNPFHGFADPSRTSLGVGRQFGARNSPTVLNRLFSRAQFWDGRAQDLEEQAHGPLTNPVEMAMGSHDDVVARVKEVAGYPPLFAKAFGDPAVTMPRIAQAIAAYERTVVTGDSPYDRYLAGDKSAMSEAQLRGMGTFFGRGRCVICHSGFNFTDEKFHNLGVGMNLEKPDLGRFVVTNVEGDKGAFKTPTLRNIVLTAPYMHDGSEGTLEEVVEFYDRGGNRNPWLSKDIQPLGLSPSEKRDLVAFMEALTGPVANADPPKTLP